MKKPILGIIAVFCAQLTFIGYNAFELPIDHAAISPVAASSLGPAVLEPESDTIVVARSGGPAASPPGFIRTHSKPVLTAARKTVARKNFVERTADMAAIRKPIVITYSTGDPVKFTAVSPVTQAVSREPEVRSSAPDVKPAIEKKSFASKALPVLKKPYDWLKAVAGKLI